MTMTNLDNILDNSVVHLCMSRRIVSTNDNRDKDHDKEIQFRSPVYVVYKYIISKWLTNDKSDDDKLIYKFQFFCSQFEIDLFISVFDSIYEGEIAQKQGKLESLMKCIEIIKCCELQDITQKLDNIDQSIDLHTGKESTLKCKRFLIIEDLCELFNIEFFKNYAYANNLISKILIKLRKISHSIKRENSCDSSVIMYERQENKEYSSVKIRKFINSLYDYDIVMGQLIDSKMDKERVFLSELRNNNVSSISQSNTVIEYVEIRV